MFEKAVHAIEDTNVVSSTHPIYSPADRDGARGGLKGL